jgi:hypothetical protein
LPPPPRLAILKLPRAFRDTMPADADTPGAAAHSDTASVARFAYLRRHAAAATPEYPFAAELSIPRFISYRVRQSFFTFDACQPMFEPRSFTLADATATTPFPLS